MLERYEMTARTKQALKITGIVAIAGILVALLALGVYFNTGIYHASKRSLAALNSSTDVKIYRGSMELKSDGVFAHPETDTVVPMTPKNGDITFVGPDPDTSNTYGLIFYPGAKVDADAYTALVKNIAQTGWLCVIADMPFDFAFFRAGAAGDIIKKHPEVEHWYIAGHSLGGVFASQYAAEHPDEIKGLMLLASYPFADLSQTSLDVITMYGSHDKVLKADAYAEARSKLPGGTKEIIIDGGNHAWFGDYGVQAGDGATTITHEEQQSYVVSAISDFKAND